MRKLGLHLAEIVAIVVKNLPGRGRNVLGILLERCIEGCQIRKSFLVRDGEHLAADAIHFVQADLVNLVGGEIADGGATANVVPVPAFATGQRGHRERRAPVRSIFGGYKLGESPIRRQHFVVGRVCNLLP